MNFFTRLSSICFAFILVSQFASAQSNNYGRFKGDITAGYSYPTDLDIKFGFNFSIEPKYNVTDNIAAGLKIEAAAFLGDSYDEGTGAIIMRSYSATGEYYFSQKKTRPYAGLGLGVYQRILTSADEEVSTVFNDKALFGFAPRIGVQVGQFRSGLEFNIAQKNTYLSLKIGATIGGKRK